MDNEQIFSKEASLTEEIAGILRERILKGEYQIGEKLKETQIASELKVSRTPIREAFRILKDEGLIEYRKNRGCFARGFTQRDIDDIYAVRKALEVLAVEWAVTGITSQQLEDLQNQLELMEFYLLRKDARQIAPLNRGFHDIIYEAAGSRFMAQVLRSYKGYIDDTQKVVLYDQQCQKEILQEHTQIYEALAEQDVERAKNAMSHHLDESKRRAEIVYHLNDDLKH